MNNDTMPPESPVGRDVRWGIAAAVAVIGVAALLVGLLRGSPPAVTPLRTVAVLPLATVEGAGSETATLGVAIADEAATLLGRVRQVAVRPGATTQPVTAPEDVRAEGRRLAVDTVLTGRVGSTNGRTAVTLDAIDVATGALAWRDSFDAPAGNLMALQVQLALRVRGGLATALGGTAVEAAHDPANEEGYALFLRSTALGSEADANREAIALLRRSLTLDPGYPPAWQALSQRYSVEARDGGAATGSPALAFEAAERAVALDPDYVVPAAGLVVSLVEKGDLPRAFTQARALLARRPDNVDVQVAMSYVYRYAGLLDDAARHCEEGFLLDPRNSTSGLRSCAVVFIQRGDEARTTNYLHLDDGSAFSRALALHADVRNGRVAQARAVAQDQLPEWGTWRLLAACAAGGRPAATSPEAPTAGDADAETAYFAASHLAYCGQTDAAAAMLKKAIAGNYCGYPLVESDPLLAPLRATPAFRALREEASNCRQRFIAAAQKAEAGG